jgi:hypothetical protein
VKRQHTIFHTSVGLVQFPKKRTGTCYVEVMFFYPVGSAGHVVHSSASRTRNIDTIFFILWWAWCSFHKMCTRTRCAEVVFLDPVGSAGHIVHSNVSGA